MIWAKESESSKKETIGLIWKSSPEKFPFVVLWNLRRGFCNRIIFVATGWFNFQWNSLLRSCAMSWYILQICSDFSEKIAFEIIIFVTCSRDKEAPLKVSQTRLENRTHRPDVELCRDPPFHRLVEEVGQIHESVDLLQVGSLTCFKLLQVMD